MQAEAALQASSDCGPFAKSVNNSISTALNRTLEGPKSQSDLHNQFRCRCSLKRFSPFCLFPSLMVGARCRPECDSSAATAD